MSLPDSCLAFDRLDQEEHMEKHPVCHADPSPNRDCELFSNYLPIREVQPENASI